MPEFMKPILETDVDVVRGPLEFSVLGAVAAARAVMEPMIEAGHGTILFTTGDHEPDEVAEVLWRRHVERDGFQVRIGID